MAEPPPPSGGTAPSCVSPGVGEPELGVGIGSPQARGAEGHPVPAALFQTRQSEAIVVWRRGWARPGWRALRGAVGLGGGCNGVLCVVFCRAARRWNLVGLPISAAGVRP